MTSIKSKILLGVIGAVALVALVFGIVNYADNAQSNLGASGLGPNHYQTENFLQGLYAGPNGQAGFGSNGALTAGGTILTVTTSTTITAAQFCTTSLLVDNASQSSTLTLPTSAQVNATCLPVNGGFRSFYVQNNGSGTVLVGFATSTAAWTIHGLGGASSSVGAAGIDKITVIRQATSTARVLLEYGKASF